MTQSSSRITDHSSPDSPGYQAALKALGDGAGRDLRIVPGVD